MLELHNILLIYTGEKIIGEVFIQFVQLHRAEIFLQSRRLEDKALTGKYFVSH